MNANAKSMIAAAALAFGVSVAASPTPAVAAGDAAAGEKVFRKCKACHFADQEKHKTGPHLVNVFGRKAASTDFKKYSKSMKDSGVVWDEKTLDQYLEAPKKFIKKGTMAFAGLKKEKDRADVIAYLKQFSK